MRVIIVDVVVVDVADICDDIVVNDVVAADVVDTDVDVVINVGTVVVDYDDVVFVLCCCCECCCCCGVTSDYNVGDVVDVINYVDVYDDDDVVGGYVVCVDVAGVV